MDGASPSLPYKNQANAWFDQKITLWWILNIFLPYHLLAEGGVNAMLFMEKNHPTLFLVKNNQSTKVVFHFISATQCE